MICLAAVGFATGALGGAAELAPGITNGPGAGEVCGPGMVAADVGVAIGIARCAPCGMPGAISAFRPAIGREEVMAPVCRAGPVISGCRPRGISVPD